MSCNKCDENTSSIEGVPVEESPVPDPNVTYRYCITPGCDPARPCGQPTCGCGQIQYASAPYYKTASMCPEDNRQKIVVRERSASFKTLSGFCMPTCGGSVRVYFDNAVDAPIGAWLWAKGYGYLTIKAFNPLNHEIEVQNDCPDIACNGEEQAAPGTTIPACTIFTVTPPVCLGDVTGNQSGIYLAAGFTAPAVDDCLTITLTGVNGLAVNRNIGILTGQYRVDAILSNTSARICNTGNGLTAGTVVDYLDSGGNFIVPVTIIDSNPCTATGILSGVPLVCDGGDTTIPLIGTQTGQVAVWDQTSQTASFQNLGIPVLNCTSLLSAVTLDPGNNPNHSYLFLVPTAEFTAADIITISGIPFTVDSIDTSGQLHATPVTDPVIVLTLPAGATVCSSGCCEENTARIEILEERVINNIGEGGGVRLYADANIADAAAISSTVITSSGSNVPGNTATLTINNGSGDYVMGTLFRFEYDIVFNIQGTADGQVGEIVLQNEYFRGVGVSVGPLLTAKIFSNTFRYDDVPGSAGINKHSFHFSETVYSGIIPGNPSPYTVSTRCRLQLNGNTFGNGVNVLFLNSRVTAIGAAVR